MKYYRCHFLLALWALTSASIVHFCFSCVLQERRALLEFKASLNRTKYPHEILPSWADHDHSDCCNWEGVKCSNAAVTMGGRRIVELHLSNFGQNFDDEYYPAGWFLNLSIFLPLQNLQALDLSQNHIRSLGHAPCGELAGFKHLQSLNLDWNFLGKTTLECLKPISSLKHLSLASNMLSSLEGCNRSLAAFKTLEYLNLDSNYLQSYGIQCVTAIASLKNLSLANNQLETLFLSKENNLKHLEYLDLSNTSPIQELNWSIGILTSLKVLSLASNYINDSSIIQGFCNLNNLIELDLRENDFRGIPMCFSNLTSLRVLDISDNFLSGNIPSSVIICLLQLEYLSLSGNNFEGSFSLSTFANHSKLQVFQLEPLGKELYVESEDLAFSPPFQLRFLYLARCNLNNETGKVPSFLFHQKELTFLDLSFNNLVGKFPNWLLENNTHLEYLKLRHNTFTGPFLSDGTYNLSGLQMLDISNNEIDGNVPQDIGLFFPSLTRLNLSSNYFEGSVPESLGNLTAAYYIDLSHNNFSGQVPDGIGTGCLKLGHLILSNNRLQGYFLTSSTNLTGLLNLKLSNNYFEGRIPRELSRSPDLEILEISNNEFQGNIPNWIGNFSSLIFLDLSWNQLEGNIPYDICKLRQLIFIDLSRNLLNGSVPSCSNLASLQSIHLEWNQITGSIPKALLVSSNDLVTLDFRHNHLSGGIPQDITALKKLKVLLLGGNYLQGQIPVYICQLKELSFIDLSQNNFSGRIPSCLNNISFGITFDDSYTFSFRTYGNIFSTNFQYDIPLSHGGLLVLHYIVQERVEFRTKSLTLKYAGDILYYMSGIDLSRNQLTGEIPPEWGNLTDIRALNLSHNHLQGSIPSRLSMLELLESVDLSYNNLSGQIPLELTNLHFLSSFNVSYNNLSGETPDGGQFATFDESNYRGNPSLCGPLLSRHCKNTGTVDPKHSVGAGENDDADYMKDFLLSFSVSFAAVLVTLALSLYLSPTYRMVSSRLVDRWILSGFYRWCKSRSK